MDERKINCSGQIPCLSGSIVLFFPVDMEIETIRQATPPDLFFSRYPDDIEATYVKVDNVVSWEIDDLLSGLFAKCNLDLLLKLVRNYDCKVLVDITFFHYETYPALIFQGKNMDIIHMLHADISIDPY